MYRIAITYGQFRYSDGISYCKHTCIAMIRAKAYALGMLMAVHARLLARARPTCIAIFPETICSKDKNKKFNATAAKRAVLKRLTWGNSSQGRSENMFSRALNRPRANCIYCPGIVRTFVARLLLKVVLFFKV